MSSQCSHYEDDDQVIFGGFRHWNNRLRNVVKFKLPSCKFIPLSSFANTCPCFQNINQKKFKLVQVNKLIGFRCGLLQDINANILNQIQFHWREKRVRLQPANPQLRDLLDFPYSSPTSLLVPTTPFHNVHVLCENIDNHDHGESTSWIWQTANLLVATLCRQSKDNIEYQQPPRIICCYMSYHETYESVNILSSTIWHNKTKFLLTIFCKRWYQSSPQLWRSCFSMIFFNIWK